MWRLRTDCGAMAWEAPWCKRMSSAELKGWTGQHIGWWNIQNLWEKQISADLFDWSFWRTTRHVRDTTKLEHPCLAKALATGGNLFLPVIVEECLRVESSSLAINVFAHNQFISSSVSSNCCTSGVEYIWIHAIDGMCVALEFCWVEIFSIANDWYQGIGLLLLSGQERREQNSAMAFCFLPVSLALCLMLLSQWQGLAVPPTNVHHVHLLLPWQAPSAWKTMCNSGKSVLRLGILCTSENVGIPSCWDCRVFLLYKWHGGYAPCMPAPDVWLDSFQGASRWGHTTSLIVLPSHPTFIYLKLQIDSISHHYRLYYHQTFPSRTTLSYLFWAKVCWFVRPGVKCPRQRPQKNYILYIYIHSLQVRVRHVSERLSHFWWCLGGISQRPLGTRKWCPKARDM